MPSRKKIIKAYVTDEEHLQVSEQAARAQLTVSTYVKRVCLGYEIKSRVEQKAILELIKIKAELGKIGGLLKHALGEKRLERSTQVNQLLDELNIICKGNIANSLKDLHK